MEKKILIVDDEVMLRRLARVVVERRGFQCEEAEDGKEALDKILEGEYIGLVTDIDMPRMDGIRLAREVENNGKLYPIIFLSGRSENREKINYSGEHRFIEKPYGIEHLSRAIEELF